MNPLMGPRLENTTVAWIAYKLVRCIVLYLTPAAEEDRQWEPRVKTLRCPL